METRMNPESNPESNSDFLAPTPFCDFEHPFIKTASQNIFRAKNDSEFLDPSQKARRAFYWVRDHIKYTLGLTPAKASETLLLNEGSCSNKANLLAALLRSQGIPTGFMIMEVNTKEYFGPTSIPRLNRYLSRKSLHVYNSIFIDDRWIQIDATDDIRMSLGFLHLSPTCDPVEFDGVRHAQLKLDPDHILSVSQNPVPSIDEIFSKSRRVGNELIQIFNFYLDFLRNHGIIHTSVQEVEKAFFRWLQQMQPELFQHFLSIEKMWENNPDLTAARPQEKGMGA